jgi:hypothetical protein
LIDIFSIKNCKKYKYKLIRNKKKRITEPTKENIHLKTFHGHGNNYTTSTMIENEDKKQLWKCKRKKKEEWRRNYEKKYESVILKGCTKKSKWLKMKKNRNQNQKFKTKKSKPKVSKPKKELNPKTNIDAVAEDWITPEIPMILPLFDEQTYNDIKHQIITETIEIINYINLIMWHLQKI